MAGGNRQPACGVHQERQRRTSYRHWQEQPGGGQRLAPDQPQAPHLTSRRTDLPRGILPGAITSAPVTVLMVGG
jgi:hypothetical protein